jgi:hypothetical protein
MSNFGLGGLRGLGGGWTLLGPNLTSQLLLDWQSLIQAFMLTKLSAGILLALRWLSLCLQFKKQYFWRNHLTFVVPFGPFVDVLACKIGYLYLVGKHVQIPMRCVILDHAAGFVRFLFLALFIVTPSDVAATFLSIGRCCGCCFGLFHLESQGKGDVGRAE